VSGTNHSEIQALIDVSARLGRDPLLVQAGGRGATAGVVLGMKMGDAV
jgi:hypothetical protein